MQAGFRKEQVEITGRFHNYSRVSEEADQKEHVFHFCPECGSQVFYTEPVGAGPPRRLGRLVRRPGVPAADRVGLQLAPPPVDRPSRRARARRRPFLWDEGSAAVRGRRLRRGRRPRARAGPRRIPIRSSSTTSPAARVRAGRQAARARAPDAGDPDVGGLPRHGAERRRLRRSARRAGLSSTARLAGLREDHGDRPGAEQDPEHRERQSGAVCRRLVVSRAPALRRHASAGRTRSRCTDSGQRERGAEQLERPRRARRQLRDELAGTDGHGEGRQAGAPPGEVGALGREAGASRVAS